MAGLLACHQDARASDSSNQPRVDDGLARTVVNTHPHTYIHIHSTHAYTPAHTPTSHATHTHTHLLDHIALTGADSRGRDEAAAVSAGQTHFNPT